MNAFVPKDLGHADKSALKSALHGVYQLMIYINLCQMRISPSMGFSLWKKLMLWLVNPDKQILDWKPVCEKTARTVGLEGGEVSSLLYPIKAVGLNVGP